MNIIDKIKSIPDLNYIDDCTDEQLEDAEKELNITFPEEYRQYLKEFGCIDFDATEFTGLGIDGDLNVVEATLAERKYNSNFPKDCFVLEDYHIDNVKVIVNEDGKVFIIQDDVIKPMCDSINDYLDKFIQ